MIAESETIIGAIRAARYGHYEQKRHTSKSYIVAQVRQGTTLLVGEGNLSFSKSLVRDHAIDAISLVATTFESANKLDETAIANAKWLNERRSKIQHGVNATSLEKYFGMEKFRTILFQFPHTGRRLPVSGRNPNHVLVKNFLKSARRQILENGQVIITHVSNPHYEGAFQFDLAAKLSGFRVPIRVPFYRSHFPSYEHRMTNECGTAIAGHQKLVSSIFKPERI